MSRRRRPATRNGPRLALAAVVLATLFSARPDRRARLRAAWDEAVKTYRPRSESLVYTFRRKSDAPCTVS